jgi:CheY-like chemotaxis protein
VQQVVVNLLSNAIKFSPPGTAVVVTTSVDGPDVRIDVRDNGRGIPEQMQERIFNRFQQVDASDSRVMEGVGLGLAICEGIVRQHGGRIWVDSTVGVGSTFSFTLPLDRVPTPGAAERAGHPGRAADREHRGRATGSGVLIVEDDVDLTEVLTAGLRDRDVDVVVTGSWTAAKTWCEKKMPEVILLDLILPDGTGADLVTWLQETGRMESVALVVYTALDVDSWHRMEMGVSKKNLFVKSQASPEVVVNRVLRLLESATPDRTVAPA